MKSFLMFIVGLITGGFTVYRLGTQSIEVLLDNGMEGLVAEVQTIQSSTGDISTVDDYKQLLIEKIEEEKEKITDNIAQSLNTAITEKINTLLGKK